MANIGILGGTFDPIHLGHMTLAEEAIKEFGLDQMLFVPNHVPWMKKDRQITDDVHRIEMVKAAISSYERYSLSMVDMEAGGDSYTYRTLEMLKEQYPNDTFYFILGADSLLTIEKWMHPEKIFANAAILAAVRDDCDMDELTVQQQKLVKIYGADIRLLHMKAIDISSTYIRKHFYSEKKAQDMLPKETAAYIKAHGLYGSK